MVPPENTPPNSTSPQHGQIYSITSAVASFKGHEPKYQTHSPNWQTCLYPILSPSVVSPFNPVFCPHIVQPRVWGCVWCQTFVDNGPQPHCEGTTKPQPSSPCWPWSTWRHGRSRSGKHCVKQLTEWNDATHTHTLEKNILIWWPIYLLPKFSC